MRALFVAEEGALIYTVCYVLKFARIGIAMYAYSCARGASDNLIRGAHMCAWAWQRAAQSGASRREVSGAVLFMCFYTSLSRGKSIVLTLSSLFQQLTSWPVCGV